MQILIQRRKGKTCVYPAKSVPLRNIHIFYYTDEYQWKNC